ncbi:MAG TPA: alpha/beta hydrolase [Streptosporangiaceae bacterium]
MDYRATSAAEPGIQMQFRVIDGLTVRFAQSEDRGAHALLLSPWPESLLAFEPVWARLAQQVHLVAMDLPGFGHSQRRDALLSPRAMGEFLIRAADAFELEHPQVLGPDIGTAASLFAAALYPGRLRSLVVGSGGAAVPRQLGSRLKEWVESPDLERLRAADPRQIVASTLASLKRYALPDSIREDYLSSYEGDRFVESMRYVRTYPAELPALRDADQAVQVGRGEVDHGPLEQRPDPLGRIKVRRVCGQPADPQPGGVLRSEVRQFRGQVDV